MKLARWSPLPPSPSGIADYVAEQVPLLRQYADVVLVGEDPERPVGADLHVYHLGASESGLLGYLLGELRGAARELVRGDA